MATNIRLRPETEAALRERSERSGVSQQELIRRALDRYLGLSMPSLPGDDWDELIARGVIRPPAVPYREPQHFPVLPPGFDSLAALGRRDHP